MAKKTKNRSKSKNKSKSKTSKGSRKVAARKPKMSPAERKRTVARRAELHRAATLLKDFHGGKLPIKSGCGRPRKK